MSRILVGDDNELIRSLIMELLESEGYEVREAVDTGDVLEQISRTEPDLLILDVQMPGGGGIEAINATRSDPAHPDMPVPPTGAARWTSTSTGPRRSEPTPSCRSRSESTSSARQSALCWRPPEYRATPPIRPVRVAAVGHVEWIEFVRGDHVPAAGEIVHAHDSFEEPAGGGAVAAVQLARLAGGATFLTAVGDDALAGRTRARLAELGVTVRDATREGPTRRGLTFLDAQGERTIITIGERAGAASA